MSPAKTKSAVSAQRGMVFSAARLAKGYRVNGTNRRRSRSSGWFKGQPFSWLFVVTRGLVDNDPLWMTSYNSRIFHKPIKKF